MPADLPLCPSCNSKQIVKNGKIHNGKQNYRVQLLRAEYGAQVKEVDLKDKRVSG